MKLRLMKLISLCFLTIPAFAMQPKSDNKQKRTYEDLVTVRSILKNAAHNAPQTPQKRHLSHIEKTLEGVNDAREQLDAISPQKKKNKTEYQWTQNTDPNIRAFPTILNVLDKPSIRKSTSISPAVKQQMVNDATELINFYKRAPHRIALRNAMSSHNENKNSNNT